MQTKEVKPEMFQFEITFIEVITKKIRVESPTDNVMAIYNMAQDADDDEFNVRGVDRCIIQDKDGKCVANFPGWYAREAAMECRYAKAEDLLAIKNAFESSDNNPDNWINCGKMLPLETLAEIEKSSQKTSVDPAV